MTTVRELMAASLIGAVTLWAVPALGQEVGITAPAPPRAAPEPIVIPPGDHGQATRPSDGDYYPQPPKVRHDPAFIGPLSSKRASARGTGRIGFAGWTSPNTPVGASHIGSREVNGWFAFGFAYEWSGPPPPSTPRVH